MTVYRSGDGRRERSNAMDSRGRCGVVERASRKIHRAKQRRSFAKRAGFTRSGITPDNARFSLIRCNHTPSWFQFHLNHNDIIGRGMKTQENRLVSYFMLQHSITSGTTWP
jgi:hypothetical protein